MICAIGRADDGTVRVCCSTHQKLLCAHHYARTHFVETDLAWPREAACYRTTFSTPDSGRSLAGNPDRDGVVDQPSPESWPPAGSAGLVPFSPDPGTCDQCSRPLPWNGARAAVCSENLGAFSFCGDGCMAVFVRTRLIESRSQSTAGV